MTRGVSLAFVVTDPSTAAHLMRGQLAHLRTEGFEIHLLTRGGRELAEVAERERVNGMAVPFEREIRPWRDLVALTHLLRALARIRPTIVCASTPKAAMLGLLAAAAVRVPRRIYLVRGLRLETTLGPKRFILALAEKVAVLCAHRIVAVSPSLRDALVHSGLVSKDKITVLGSGSSNGVDTDRFRPRSSDREEDGRATADAPAIGFIGRLVRDKGIEDLVEAFKEIVSPRLPSARLRLIGRFEAGDPIRKPVHAALATDPGIVLDDFTADSSQWYSTIDVLAFPSYREGLPNAVIEAAACEVPTVAYRATGSIDAIEDGVTGRLVDIGDREALGQALCAYLESAELRRRHGTAARQRVVHHFSQQVVWRLWADFFKSLVASDRAEGAS